VNGKINAPIIRIPKIISVYLRNLDERIEILKLATILLREDLITAGFGFDLIESSNTDLCWVKKCADGISSAKNTNEWRDDCISFK
jgi:hypothetical protein